MQYPEEQLVKASLVAGLKLFNLPCRYMGGAVKDTRKEVKEAAKKLGIDLSKFKEGPEYDLPGSLDSGLIWGWPEKFIQEKISDRIKEQSEAVGFEDLEECCGNSGLDDFEYMFNIHGTGWHPLNNCDIFRKKYRSGDRLYTYYAGESWITEYEMDIGSIREMKEFIKKLMIIRRLENL